MSTKNTKKKTPKIEFAPTSPKRFRDVPLAYPLLVDGEEVKKITIRRLISSEVRALQAKMDAGGLMFESLIEPFTDQPQCVLDALDEDDFAAVAEAVLDFLPVKLREELERVRARMEELLQDRMKEAADQEANA